MKIFPNFYHWVEAIITKNQIYILNIIFINNSDSYLVFVSVLFVCVFCVFCFRFFSVFIIIIIIIYLFY